MAQSTRHLALGAVVFAVAAVLLGWGYARSGIAAAYTDPVGRVHAQDESVYANAAIALASEGGWLTPRFQGRYILYKPPLVQWLAGASVALFGISLAALRLPVLLAGAFGLTLLFLWLKRMRSAAAAFAVLLLLASDPLWHTLSRLCYTDMLLAACIVTSMFALGRDPRLEQRSSAILFGLAVGFGVLAKSAGGLLPVFVLVLFVAVRGRGGVPAIRSALLAGGVAAIVALPWHVYQLVAHREWFWMDYVRIQLLGFGVDPPNQHASESTLWFYARRLWLTDPVLCVCAGIALPGLVVAIRKREPTALLLGCWAVVSGAAVLAFRYRNLPYLLCLVAPLAVIAAAYFPRRAAIALGMVLVAGLGIRAAVPNQPWSLNYGPGEHPAAASLIRYCEAARASELIAVDTDDDFYSSTLPIHRVRYVFVDPDRVTVRYAPHYATLGIITTVNEFLNLPALQPVFTRRLSEWGLQSSAPVASAIVADSPADVLTLIAARPHSDFYLPDSLRTRAVAAAVNTHRFAPAHTGRFFLISRDPQPSVRRVRPVPVRW